MVTYARLTHLFTKIREKNNIKIRGEKRLRGKQNKSHDNIYCKNIDNRKSVTLLHV